LLPLVWSGGVDRGAYNIIEIVCILPISVILPVLLLNWYRRGNREAGWLILPSVLPLLTICLNDVGIVGDYLGSPRLTAVGSPIPLGSLAIQPYDLAELLFLLAIGIVIFLRFNRVSRDQARSAAELEAAQRVQTLLLRSPHTDATRFRMNTVYRPAAEVGGDFFHAAEIDGCTRIVVGDVSGKGLGAAMMVSALIGALDGNRSTEPAALLAQLNELLLVRQNDGFVTCLCACIRPDARVTIANAGHLSPYLNGEELSINSGLPLGICPGVDYTGTLLHLDADDLLTFVSDGVIEARNNSGELFGFDRTRQISHLSADHIAQAAQAFGQQDDITVLTLRYMPSEALQA
jgi:serine phosphatase RsbU (regulator of sigma subunit)